MHISTMICIGIAVLIILASNDDIMYYRRLQKAARESLKAWRHINRKKVSE